MTVDAWRRKYVEKSKSSSNVIIPQLCPCVTTRTTSKTLHFFLELILPSADSFLFIRCNNLCKFHFYLSPSHVFWVWMSLDSLTIFWLYLCFYRLRCVFVRRVIWPLFFVLFVSVRFILFFVVFGKSSTKCYFLLCVRWISGWCHQIPFWCLKILWWNITGFVVVGDSVVLCILCT